MAIGSAVVSATDSVFFCFEDFFFVWKLILRLLFLRRGGEVGGTGADNDFGWLDTVIDCAGPLSDRRHAAETEVPFIGSSTSPWTSLARGVNELFGSIRTLILWGGVGGGPSPVPVCVSCGG